MKKYCMKCMMPMGEEDQCLHCGHQGETVVAPHRLAPGTILNNRYLIGLAIGQGGFGITYMGRDLTLDMRVAVKEYYPNGYTNRNSEVTSAITIADKEQADFIESGKKKFLTEARALAQFHAEQGVVEVRDFFEENKTAYIVMEYLDGQDLRKVLRKRLFTADEIFALVRPIMDALVKVHEVGIVHRDISPDNIMLLKNGSVKLMDFGAARILDLSDQKSVSVVLKAGYAPEEQYRPKGKQGPWTDIYALCATMYKCMTGITPDDALERSHKDELKWPSEIGIDITVLQEDILKKGMAVKAEDRFQNISELLGMLNKVETVHAIEIGKPKCEGPGAKEGPKEEGPKEEDQKKEPLKTDNQGSSKKKLPIVGIGLAACVMGAVFGMSKLSGKEKTFDPSEIGINEGYYHITLTVKDEMTVKGFNKAIETLTGRIEVLTNGEPYGFKVNDDNIELALPEWVLGNKSIKEVMQCYLARAINFYAFEFYSKDYIKIEREDMETVEFAKGPIEGLDPAAYEMEADEYEYVKLVLTEEYAKEHAAIMANWGEYLRFGQDIEQNRSDLWYYTDIFTAGDGRTFYILDTGNPDLQAQTYFNELLQWNLTHDILECGFWFNYNLDEGVEWQSAAGEDKPKSGELQHDFAELSGDTITVRMVVDKAEDLSEGQWIDLEGHLKKRLDALEQPYAFGFYRNEESVGVAVKTDVKHMGYPIWTMLGETESPYLQIGNYQMYGGDNWTLELDVREDGTYQIIASVENDYYKNSIYELVDLIDGEQIPIHMHFNSIPYLSGILDRSALADKNEGAIRMTFDEMYYFEEEGITEDNKWFAEYLNQTYLGEKLPSSLSLDTWGVDPAIKEKYQDWYQLPVSDIEHLNKIENQIQEIVTDAEVFDNGGAYLYVKPHLNVDKNFAQNILDVTEKIYEAIDFENSRYIYMYVYLTDEDDTVQERARMIFSRYAQWGTPGDLSKIQIEGLFCNGRMEDYKAELQTLIEKSEFCQRFDQQNWSFAYEQPQF